MMGYNKQLAFLMLFGCLSELASQAQSTAVSKLVRVGAQPGGYRVQVFNRSIGWTYTATSLWRTTNGGLKWTTVSFPRPQSPEKVGVPPASLISVVFESAVDGWLSVENSKQFPTVVQQRSVFRTSDGGRTWLEQPSSALAEKGTQYSQFYLRRGLVGWEGGAEPVPVSSPTSSFPICKPWWDGRRVRPVIFHTEDSGATWVEQDLPDSRGCRVDELLFKNAQEGIAVAEHDVYYTEDGGTTWHKSDFLTCCTDSDWHLVFSMPPASIFVMGATAWLSYEDGYMFKSLDGGKSWKQLAHPGQIWRRQAVPGDYGALFFTSDQHGFILGGDHAVHETIDGGVTWLRLGAGAPMNALSCSEGTCWALSDKELYRIDPR